MLFRHPLLLFAAVSSFGASVLSADPAEIPIVSRAEWNALEARPYGEQTPVRFTIHHSAVAFDKSRDAATHIRNIQSWGMGEARNWTDLPYHYVISPKGEIFEGRNPFVRGESNTPYDTEGHLQINCLGNFNEQEPTAEQLDSLVRLIVWASLEFDIPTSTITGHRDHASTQCPGRNLYRLVQSGEIRRRADKIIEKKSAQSAKTPTGTEASSPASPRE